MIRVVLAEDHHLVRQGIRLLLEQPADIEVVGEAENGWDALHLVREHQPDVLVLDIAMPHCNGLEVLRQMPVLELPARVVVLSVFDDHLMVQRALHQGATGYLLKRSVTEELLLAVRAASRGETYLSPAVSQAVMSEFLFKYKSQADLEPFDRLSQRERQVLQLLFEGHTNPEVAHHLRISVKTVEKHRSNLMSKLDVHDLANLIRVALKYGLIVPDSF